MSIIKVCGLKQKLTDIQESIQTVGASQNLLDQEIIAKQDYMHAFHIQDSFWREKCRLKWLVDGDRCSKFFHTYAKVCATKSSINSLLINDVMVDDQDALSTYIVNYFEQLYSFKAFVNQHMDILSHIPHLVTDIDNENLCRIPSSAEIKDTIFSMDPNNALCLDGQLMSSEQSNYFLRPHSIARKTIVESILGFKEGIYPFVYLGVPVFRGSPKGVNF
ncbi:hypothetical protein Ddye_005162 [Dipteronia dyeriana]|uniref:Uncharacterized protein n=1 Tax=Dipteronia dyeriana TaxID=168575 RepID=A0AAE0CPH4_9ROSI|nr:hypothetical protein Ddye_005162 [Dipteronia dyeriana]